MAEKGKSGKPAGAKERICKLKKDGKLDEVELHEQKPVVFCSKCKAKSDDPSYLCNPRALKAPKVEKV